MKIVVYQALDAADPAVQFVAYLFEGTEPLPIRFFAVSADESARKAHVWLEAETERQARLWAGREERVARLAAKRAKKAAKKAADLPEMARV